MLNSSAWHILQKKIMVSGLENRTIHNFAWKYICFYVGRKNNMVLFKAGLLEIHISSTISLK